MKLIDALTESHSTGKACRPKRWSTDRDMKHYVIGWHNPPGTYGVWVMKNLEDPDAVHMALLPAPQDLTGDWEFV